MLLFEMRQATDEAKTILSRADFCASELAIVLRGRLRHVSSTYTLSELKKELKDFNAHTGEWKT